MEEEPIPSMQYPPGIRFHPSDEELISYYLERKVKCLSLPPNVITDIELYSYNPWELPRKTLFGEDEWYFFTPRDRKYPNGGRPNRTTASGYWKATGTDKPILSSCGSRKVGVKKTLVFYRGKPPSGHKMDWTMTEYRLPDASRPSRSKGSMRLDDWVLCRIRQKGNMSKNEHEDEQSSCEFQKESSIKNFSSGCIQDNRDMLTDYNLQSSEHQRISLLLGHDPGVVTNPTTIYENNNRTVHENRSRTQNVLTTQDNFYIFSDSLVPSEMMTYEAYPSGQMVATKSHSQHLLEANNCKPNYPLNANINYQHCNNTLYKITPTFVDY